MYLKTPTFLLSFFLSTSLSFLLQDDFQNVSNDHSRPAGIYIVQSFCSAGMGGVG